LGRPFAIGSHFSHFGLKEKKSFLSAIIEWKEGKEEEKEKEKKRKKRKENKRRWTHFLITELLSFLKGRHCL